MTGRCPRCGQEITKAQFTEAGGICSVTGELIDPYEAGLAGDLHEDDLPPIRPEPGHHPHGSEDPDDG
jgi:hypothetical protein